jgi:hypothetical protein
MRERVQASETREVVLMGARWLRRFMQSRA